MLFEYADKELFFIKQAQDDRVSYAVIDSRAHILYELSIVYTYIETCTYDIIDESDLDKLDTNFISNVIQEVENMINNVKS